VDPDPASGQRREEIVGQERRRGLQLPADDGSDAGELLAGRQTVRAGLHQRCRLQLLVQPGDANHEELVQIRRVDGQELQPLQQRPADVERLVEHPGVERQPGGLAVDVERRIDQVVDRRLHAHDHRGDIIHRAVASVALLPRVVFGLGLRWLHDRLGLPSLRLAEFHDVSIG
jgi:hypothetical protein